MGRVGWLLAVLGGCGSSDAPPVVSVYEVEGRILLSDSKPLPGGSIYFVPWDGTVIPQGKIGSDGSFSLETGRSGRGAPPGEYRVRIEPDDPSLLPGKRPAVPGKKLPFPSKYLDEDTSGLRVTVKTEPNRLAPLLLK